MWKHGLTDESGSHNDGYGDNRDDAAAPAQPAAPRQPGAPSAEGPGPLPASAASQTQSHANQPLRVPARVTCACMDCGDD